MSLVSLDPGNRPQPERWRRWLRDGETPGEVPWWRERRWIIAFILIATIVLLGAVLIAWNRATQGMTEPQRPAEAGTEVVVSAPEPGTAARVSAQDIPVTVLQVTGRGDARTPQTVVVLDDEVLFDFDRAELRPESAVVLDQLVDLIQASDDAAIDLTGYTDALGAEGYNLELSRERTEAVVGYLSAAGVSGGRLNADWRGEEDPVEPNSRILGDNPEGRAQNRRVEVVLDDDGAPQAAPPGSRLGADEHPNGTVLAVDALTAGPRGIVVDARIANRAPTPVEVGDEAVWLVDNLGYAYRLQPSWQNPSLSLAGGTTVTAKLAFLGVVPAEATSFTLLTNVSDPNDGIDVDRRRESDSTPSLLVERIPRG